MNNLQMHKSITAERILPLAESQMFGLENPGVCLACGAERDGCEPDASGYECYECGENKVMGATDLMMIIG